MKTIRSFKYAAEGVLLFFRHERNARIQFFAATVSVVLGLWLHITTVEWIAVLLCITAVFSLEMVNTALEKLCDLIQPEYHPAVKVIKDVSAGAVLLSAVASLVIGIIIFLPRISELLKV
ncbi:MAG: diacylglycerol kinase family protein [Chitinophagaceae bacterium]|nr:diacylglycerol kinase family protein [Chitinophagaceae bacterium]